MAKSEFIVDLMYSSATRERMTAILLLSTRSPGKGPKMVGNRMWQSRSNESILLRLLDNLSAEKEKGIEMASISLSI